jgi:hypothetical protein
MTATEIIKFYDDINKISSFERIRKIFELTNNLDPYLLYHLKRDFTLHYFKKLKKVITEKGDRSEEEIEGIFGDVFENYDFENYLESFDFSFKSDFEQDSLYDMYDEINDFIYELEDLNFYVVSNKTEIRSSASYNDYKEPSPYEGMDSEEWFELQDKMKAEAEEAEKQTEQIQQLNEEQENEPISMSISMKIIYLQRLGVIDFLRQEEPFSTSTNSLAKVFSRIIGAKPATVQPYLNAMLSRDVNSKNNPLNSDDNVEAVEFYLAKMGYRLRKRNTE